MGMATKLRSILLAGSAIALIAGCTDSDISSPGEGDFIGAPPGGGGGGGGGGATGMDFTPAAGCPAGTSAQPFPTPTSDNTACLVAVDANGVITGDVTLAGGMSNDNLPVVYFFEGATFVGTDDGTTPGAGGGTAVDLEIGAGAVLAFASGTDFLTVNRGSRILADGTPSAPIIMTSDEDILDDGFANDSQGAARGQWGGLILNGRAPINSCADPSMPAMCETSGEGGTGNYGGAVPDDDSGILNYVRVQYAGFEITTDNELNGIAFQGVGDSTLVDFIQVHNNDDDGVEFFGGTVDVRHVVLTGVDDDALDWVAGWIGSAQDILVIGSGVGDNGFEGDSNSSNNDIMPRSNPLVSNFTLIGGPSEDLGMQIRVGTGGLFINGIVTGWEDGCLDIDDDATLALVEDGSDVAAPGDNDEDLQIDATYFSCDTPFDDLGNDGSVDITTAFSGISTGPSTLSGVLPGANEQAVTALDPSVFDTDFAAEEFIGAFEPGLEPSETWAFGWTVPGSVFPPQGCPTGTTDVTASATVTPPAGGSICELPGTVSQDTTLTAGNFYQLNGPVFVGEDVGPDSNNPTPGQNTVDLTIQAGVTVYGLNGTDFLTVNRGSRLFSNGTEGAPVIFTSDEDLRGENTGSERGQWGGLIINGNAPINSCADPSMPASCETSGEGGTGNYGGNDANDDSGVLNFTRVQFAGFEITTDNELNGIAFQGVGDSTEVDFIQVHNNDDDGVEFFGGTVDVKHVVLTGVDDDALDWVAGWDGSAQFILIQGSGVGDNGFEGDNNSSNNDISPRSMPSIANWTAIGGPNEDLGMQIREGTAGMFVNGVVTDWDDGCLDIDNDATANQVTMGNLVIDATFFGCATPFVTGDEGDAENALADTIGASFFPGVVTGATSGMGPEVTLSSPVTPITGSDLTMIDPALDGDVTAVGLDGQDDDWYLGWTVPGSF